MPADKRYTVEGYWDCQYCGKTGIPGRFRSCVGCGHPRDASVKFYTKEIGADHAITREEFAREQAEADKNSQSSSATYTEATEVSDGNSLYSQGAGARAEQHDETDWYCDFCDSYNPATVTVCQFCGAAREDTEGKTYRDRQGQMARTYDSKGNLVSERDLSKKQTPPPSVAPPSGGPGCLPIIIGAIVVMAVVGLLSMVVFGPKSKSFEVAGFDWQQTIQIEELQTVEESGWRLPDNARLIRTNKEVSGYNHILDHYEQVPYQVSEQVLDHYETYTTKVDNGDGTFDVEEHQEPVYRTEHRTEYRDEPVYIDVPVFDTKYYYEIERWVDSREVTTEGDDHEPYWGDVELSGATGDHGTGEEREGDRSGVYGVFDSDGNHYTADKDFWDTLVEGDDIKVKVDSNGHITPKK